MLTAGYKVEDKEEKMASESHSRVALVTGAAMGIGAAIAEQLARDGMTVLVSDINIEEAEKTAGRFREGGLSAQALQLDVGLPASVDAAEEKPGSWWPDWDAWMRRHSDGTIPAPERQGNAQYISIEPAPGRYVKHKSN